MTPADLSLPWSEWRRGQWEVIARAVSTDKRYVLIEAPPGIGKTGIALAIARLLDARAHYLTGTIQLQQQYAAMPNVTQVMGRPNFDCLIQPGVKASEAPCTAGMKCEYAGSVGLDGCDYFDQKKQASHAHEVVFNYPYWLRQINYAGWKKPEVLVCDEAHTLSNQVRSFATVPVRRTALGYFHLDPPTPSDDYGRWYWWAADHITDVGAAVRHIRNSPPHEQDIAGQRRARAIIALHEALVVIANPQNTADDWIVQENVWGWEFKPVWVHGLVPKYVLQHAEQKVVMLSATILNKEVFCGLNGIRSEDAEFIATPSTFDKRRRPILYRPVGRINKGHDIGGLSECIRGVLRLHPDERGIIHTVSHKLAGQIADSLHSEPRIITHTAGRDRLRALADFRAIPGAVLISPSMHTGVDLPYDLCRFQVICKLPFPDLGDPLVKAQMANATRDNPLDKGNRAYTYDTAATLVQTYGRIMRAEDDSGTTYLLDGNYKWFRYAAKEFLPRWFTEAVKVDSDDGPDPNEVLRELRAGALAAMGR